MKHWKTLTLASLVALTACNKEEENQDTNPNSNTEDEGVVTYVINEGAFQGNNASISSIDEEGNVSNNLFNVANDKELGDVAQSMSVAGDKGFIALNNSQKLQIVDLPEFTSVGEVTMSYPRFSVVDGNNVYVSNGSSSGTVFIVDATSGLLVDSVAVGNGPEQMVVNSSDLFVANSGGWGSDSTVFVVDLNTNEVTDTVFVGHTPYSVLSDDNGGVWVLCKGKKEYNDNWELVGGTGPSLVKINATSYEVEKTISLGDYTISASKMAIDVDNQNIYYVSSGVYKISTSASTAPASPLISEGNANGVAVNPDGNIVVLVAPDFASNGNAKTYDTEGNLIESVEVGIAPNGVVFR